MRAFFKSDDKEAEIRSMQLKLKMSTQEMALLQDRISHATSTESESRKQLAALTKRVKQKVT